MNRILLLLLLLVSFANAQTWQPTSIRQRFVNGIGIPTRDTITGTAADSSQLVLRPQDSVIYYKYKGYWRALASGGSVALYTSTVKHEVKAAVAITKGQAVYVSSADGTNMIVSKSDNSTEQTSSKTMGLLESTVAANGKTFVITEGLLAGLNTSMAAAGDAVWLGTNGDLLYGIANKPKAPAHMVFIGIVTRSNVSNGEIFVKVQNGFELDELHDVAISSPRNQSIILYDSVNKLWRDTLASVVTANKVNYTDTAAMLAPYLRSATATATYEPKITAGTTSQYWRGDKSWQTLNTAAVPESGNLYYTDARARAALSLTTTGSSGAATYSGGVLNVPTYTLSGLGGQPQLNGTGFVKASGTTISYDNSTYYLASNPNGYTTNTGTVTSIATTAPLTGGTITTSGTLGITQATTSTSGFLSSTDWNTFNGKQNALTNPTTGTGTTNYVTKWTGGSTLGNSTIFDNGNVGIGTTSPSSILDIREANRSNSSNITNLGIYTTTTQNTDIGGTIGLGGLFNGTDISPFGSIRGGKENSTSGNYAGYLAFQTIQNNGTLGERMRITSAGNVGIGTTSPAALLSVQGTTLIGGNTDDGTNKLQVTGSIKSTSLAGTGERLVTADASGKLLAGTGTFTATSGTYTPTYTAITNTTATGFLTYSLSYTVVGNVVTIFGRVNINSSTPNSVTTVDMTTPTAVQYITSGSVGGAGTEIATDGSRTQGTLGFIESPVNTPINLIRILCKPMLSGNLVQYRFTVSYLINTSL